MNKKSDWDEILNPSIYKRIVRFKNDLLRKFNIWTDIKFGYIAKDGQPLKCFKCYSRDMEEWGYYYMDGGYIDEYSVKCKVCGQKLGHWAYGNWEM